MKKIIITGIMLTVAITGFAQKKALDHSIYDGWQTTSSPIVSNDGKCVVYTVNPQEGDSKLYVKNLESGAQACVERGTSPAVSNDSKWVVFTIKAPFAETRDAKIKKKKSDEMPKDSLGLINIKTLEITKVADVNKFKSSLEKKNRIYYETGKKDSVMSVIFTLDSERRDTLKNVDKYTFDKEGNRIAVVFKKSDKDSLSKNEVKLFDLKDMTATVLSTDKQYYSSPKFNEEGNKVVFLASADSNKTGDKHCSVILYELGSEAAEIIPQGYSEGLPKGMTLTQNADPFFSRLSDRLFVGISEPLPEDDTTLVDFETAQLDIWSWDIYMTPPMQKANSSSLKAATCPAVIDLNGDRSRIVALSSNIFETISLVDGGEADFVIAKDRTPYQVHSTWDSNSLTDVYIVNVKDGTRNLLFKGLNGSPSVSPAGKYLTWYDESDSDWYSYRFADGKKFNLTEKVKGTFYDDEDDHPMPAPEIDTPHWIEGDEAFLLAEKFDVWKIFPDGKKAVCLTEGKGKKNNIQYRYVGVTKSRISSILSEAGVRQGIEPDADVFLTTFDRAGKKNGFAKVNVAKAGLKESFVDEHSYSAVYKALDGNTVAFKKGDFRHPMDVYVTSDFWKTEEKQSAINPQQEEYRWGDVQLVHWNAYDGTPLDGLLYTPDNMEPGRKYPMMVYFYEKNAETLYNYISPAPSRSVICIPFYVSRGYVVFVPDIVYVDGHPGESAWNCICSGAEAMCGKFSFIDKDKMAIQGQSWGGYQTAYLVTRTNMFAAAGAGAPVGNMTSAYGGIRWESGMVRAMQYEHGQSRIGKSLWDEGGLDLYIENSPVFHTQNVTTPVLIMHNDNDGAVPWYQGIEFFMALRRFEHPAWLLEYNNEAHNLVERRNCKDLSIRLQQFFDHYLKGDPMPAWMKSGVPVTRKGQYFGFEY